MSNPTTPFSWQMPTATDLVTDLPADFEVFGQAVATSMADLLGGSSGYILSKASATDMDFTWIANDQGDITGVTAGTGISVTSPTGPVPTVAIDATVATLTGTQTLTNKTLTSPALTTPTISTATTNGDILYGTGSGALARLGIGSSAQILTVASGLPSWATPSGGNTFTTFTPSFTAITIGNGTVVGRQCTNGSLTTVFIKLTFGSTTSVTGNVVVAVPTAIAQGMDSQQFVIGYRDASTTSQYLGTTYQNGANSFYIGVLGTSGVYANTISSSSPFTWATNDTIALLIQYEV